MTAGPGDPRDELVEHVDADGEVIEVVTRARMRAENLRHRSVAIAVIATDGRLLVHRRADDKDVYPGWWDIVAGGVVAAGEASDDAARRELAEELGIDGVAPRYLGRARHDDDHAREVCAVYRVVHDGPFRFADGEIVEARWVPRPQLPSFLAQHQVLPGSVAMLPLLDGIGVGGDPLRCSAVQRIEFTVEPFVEGNPGRHVTAPVEALRALGVEVDFGPFGSQCTVPTAQTADAVAAIVAGAVDHGATHVTIDVTALDDHGGDG